MKKILCLLTAVVMVLCLASCSTQTATDTTTVAATTVPTTAATAEMNVYVLSGPTGIGALNLWSKADAGTTQNKYNFTLTAANDEIVAAVSNGKADIAAVATNLGATLYNKTKGNVSVLAVNTLGVLSMLTNGDDIKSVADLKGKTIYAPGQGANPEYILRYVLKGNGLDPDKDVKINFVTEGTELMSVWSKDSTAVIMAPQPVATTLKVNNKSAKTVFDMTEEWDKIAKDGSTLMMGCVIVNNEFLKKNEGAVKTFLQEYEESVNAATTDIEGTATLCEEKGIIPKAAIAKVAIPNCGLTFVSGTDMKTKLSGYLKVMFDANAKSVGGKLPADDFYYVGE